MEVLQRTANRGSISTATLYDIDNSLKFEPDNSEYLKSNGTHAYTTPTSTKKGTVSFWIKRTEIGNNVSGKQMYIFASANSARYSNLGFDEFDNLTVFSGDSSWNSVSPYTYNKFRDTSAWYHIVLRYDSTDGTASNRLRVYSNGTEVSWVVAPNITQNGDMTYSALSGPTWHSWGTIYAYFTPEKFFAGYLAEAHFVDGQSLAPTEFGEYDDDSGIWKPKEYDGTYGNAGYYLDFADSGNLGDDESGNGLDFDENSITAADQATDTPTNNFCTLNPLMVYGNALTTGPIEGATKVSGGGWAGTRGTMGVNKGKWYYEFKASGADSIIGIQTDEGVALTGNAHNILSSCSLYLGGEVYIKDSSGGRNDTDVTHTFNANSIYAVAINMDDNEISFYQDGSLITNGGGIDIDGLSDQVVFPFGSNYNKTQEFNFGGYTSFSISSAANDANGYGTFEYAPPSGYYALCTKNLAEFG